MEKELQVITRTRKERIFEERNKATKARQRKMMGYALAGTIATSAFLSVGPMQVAACSDAYIVQKGDTLFSLAKKYGVSVDQMKNANSLTSDVIKIGQTLAVPHVHIEETTYIVQRGDTLFSLAKKHGVTVRDLKAVNDLGSDQINVGQALVVPVIDLEGAPVHIAELSVVGDANVDIPKSVSNATYTVAPGDTLWSIARRLNTSVGKIKSDNGMRDDIVLIGQKLAIKQDGMLRAPATVVGVVDNFSVEFIIGGEPKVMQVAYGKGTDFGDLSGKKVEIVYSERGARPSLVSYSK